MDFAKYAVVFFIALMTLPALAAPPLATQPQVIQRYSMSPGASGSISESSRSQTYDVPLVPGVPNAVSTHSSTVYGGSSVQQSGGIRQSTEYPNGMRVEQHSGQGSYRYQRDE